MKQIYNFDKINPPCLNERYLRKEAERRKLQRQTILLTVAAILSQMVVLLFGILMWQIQPVIAFVCILYVLTATLSGSVIMIAFTKKRRIFA